RLPLQGVEAYVVSAGGAVLSEPLTGAGQTNPSCTGFANEDGDGTENFRSIGVRLTFGAFAFVDLGDLSLHTLTSLVCPNNLIVQAAVYLVAHHGNYDTNYLAVLSAINPRAVVLNNGPTKGGDPDTFNTLRARAGLDTWQLHESRNPGANNASDAYIANVDD